MKKELARIKSAKLEIKERGILNLWIHMEYENGGCQAFGGMALDVYSKERKEREGTAYGCELIRQILLLMNVNDFSEIKDVLVWALRSDDSFQASVIGIERLKVDGGKRFLLSDLDYLLKAREQ